MSRDIQRESHPEANRANNLVQSNEFIFSRYNWPDLIVEGLDEVVFSVDQSWRFSYVNSKAAQIWGRTAESLTGKVMWEEFPVLVGSKLEKFYRAAMASSTPTKIEEYTQLTGQWYDIRTYPIPQGLTIYFQDITERKQLEISLQESEARFKILSEASFEGIIIHDNGTILEANQNAVLMFGFADLNEFKCQHGRNIFAHESEAVLIEHATQSYSEPFEVVGLRKDGTYFPVEVAGKFIEYYGRTVRIATIRDITNRKQTHQALQDSEARYRILSEASYEGLAIISNGQLIDANERLATMFGYSLPEFLQLPLEQLLAPQTMQLLRERIVSGATEAAEGTGIRKDGSRIVYEARGSTTQYKGQPSRVVAIRDITELKEAQQKLKESEERYRVLSEAAFDAVIIQDNGIIVEVNEAASQMTGYSREELTGKPVSALVVEESQLVQQSLGLDYTGVFEMRGLKKDGSIFPVEGRRRNAVYQGRPVVVASIHDVSAKHELLKTQSLLLQAQKMESIGRLAGGIAHDFNNLLTVIINYSELAQIVFNNKEKVISALTEIEKAGERAATLTRQLLAFSRQQVLQPKIFALNEIVTDMDKMLKRLIGEDIELVTIAEPTENKVLADPGQMEQVIVNLVVNARDAIMATKGGKITLETNLVELDEHYHLASYPRFKAGHYVMLAVSDNGIGMDEATQERIFEPFFTTKPVGQGTGLGLSTVFGIIEQSGGYIWVYSKLGVGTTFKVYLPVVQEEVFVSELNTSEMSQPEFTEKFFTSSSNYNILVVEDELTVRELVEQILTEAGYNVLLAGNGQQALELLMLESRQIDLVLTDIIMPQMGGHALITELRTRWPKLKVVGMSGYTDQAVQRYQLLEEYNGFVQKPFTQKMLLNSLERLLR